MNTDLKIYGLNLFAFIFSFSDADYFLRILLVVISILYTLHKWYLLSKRKK